MSEKTGVSIDEMLKEVRREIEMRQRVYPRWVEKGIMKPSEAIERQRVMQSVLEELEKRKQPNLI